MMIKFDGMIRKLMGREFKGWEYDQEFFSFILDRNYEGNIKSPKASAGNLSLSTKDRLCRLEKWLLKHNMDKSDVCIISTVVLELYGLKTANDLDIIMKQDKRSRLGYEIEVEKLASDIDLVHRNYVRDYKDKVIVSDDEIIDDPSNHIICNGFKFAKIEYILIKKFNAGRKKDWLDFKILLTFFEYNMLFGNEHYRRDLLEKIL